MAAFTPTPFGAMLHDIRRNRHCLTQGQLAERSTLSYREIGNLETGRTKTAHRTTLELLADALQLHGEERERFIDLGSHKPRPRGVSDNAIADPCDHKPPTMADADLRQGRAISEPIPFVGREPELSAIVEYLRRGGPGMLLGLVKE